MVRGHSKVYTRNEELLIISCGELSGEILARVIALGGTVNQEKPSDLEDPDKFIHFEIDGVQYGADRTQFLETGCVLLPGGMVIRINTWNETAPPTPRTWSVVQMAKAYLLP